jgi:Lactoylglutathione lyase and related lyases
MRIDHLALWCDDIEAMRAFYIKYFGCKSNAKYSDPTKGFTSYFLSFPDGNTRIELMNKSEISQEAKLRCFSKGIAHCDIEVGDELAVDFLATQLKNDGYIIASPTCHTGDGYYEVAILDPEGNYVELSASKK